MNILIIENEIYLAHSIASRLREIGHTCDSCISLEDTAQDIQYDTVLLSSNLISTEVESVVKRYESSIIILLVSYVSNDTVTIPLNLGARDYILKPFMVDELIKKIDHYKEYELEKSKMQRYEKYLSHVFESSQDEFNETELKLPLFISSSFQKDSDAFAYKYSIKNDIHLNFLSLKSKNAMQELEDIDDKCLMYITDFHSLKSEYKKQFFKYIGDKKVIVSNSRQHDTEGYKSIHIGCQKNIFNETKILTIEEYIKYVILTYQSKMTDVTLAVKLKISRKSIWEKRKKHSIQKVKSEKLKVAS